MPSDQALEKSSLLLKLGAVVERVTPAPITSPDHFVNLAQRRAEEHTRDPNKQGRGFFANQFETEANYEAHYETTGPEIFKQVNGKVDAFVAGAGTGGTISGVSKYLQERLPRLRVVLADPQGSGLYNKVKHGVMFSSTEREGTRRRQQVDTIVEGIGINRLTHNFDIGRHLITDAVKVNDEQAKLMARWLVEKDGLFVGSSTAVNCVAALKIAAEMPRGSRIVTVICDSGTRHLSKFWNMVGDVGGASDKELSLEDIVNAGL
jgi:cysteine synthase A